MSTYPEFYYPTNDSYVKRSEISDLVGSVTAISNKATGGAVGTAAATVDISSTLIVTQTTAGQTLTLPTPSTTTAGKEITILNSTDSTTSFTMLGNVLAAGAGIIAQWDGSAWAVIGTSSTASLASTSSIVNGGLTRMTPVAITNKATGGAIGTAAATVDVGTIFTVNQTTAAQDLTLPSPTTATTGAVAIVVNIGSASFTMYGRTLTATAGTQPTCIFVWTGAAWK